MSASLTELHPALEPWARALISYYPAARVTSTLRTRSEQQRLYNRYLAGQTAYPAAPPGQSMHELGRAWDMIAPIEILVQLGLMWESVGGRWGGRIGDPIHFEA